MIFSYHNSPIYYTDQGSGPAIIFLHGFLESSTMWKEIIPHFTTSNRVITLDFPGHGKTPTIKETHSMEFFAAIVAELVAHLKIKQITVVGHSMGGYVSMAMTTLIPQQIRTLVLLASSPDSDSEARKQNRERALELVPNAKDAFVSMAISNLFNEHSRKQFSKEISEVKEEALALSVEGITAAIRGMKNRKNRTSMLKDFNNPKYMICGTNDSILPISSCETIAEATNTVLLKVTGSHMIHIEKRDEIVKLLHLIENNCV
ncbi:alpha/beta hydrolase [Rasiella rasia]|uniref:Alpha/beta hydrolase n=1 Tax=Rasiella rasia TaxID=2744027 RepID=A0A6G6GM36_9FLAO|nr:alpha/beta hydrolase [Rasiella rasia]QIE59608.1 alpha/beta hydrolase [Rasiella rasia]